MNLQELKDNNIEYVLLMKPQIILVKIGSVTENTLTGYVFSQFRENANGIKDIAEYTLKE